MVAQETKLKKTHRFKRVRKPKKLIQPDVSVHTAQKSETIPVKPKSHSRRRPGILSISNPPLSFDEMKILSTDFFQIDALDLAPRLLGKLLRRDDVVLRITEVMPFFNCICFSRKTAGRNERELQCEIWEP